MRPENAARVVRSATAAPPGRLTGPKSGGRASRQYTLFVVGMAMGF